MSDIVSCNENELLLLDMSAKLVEPCSDTISRKSIKQKLQEHHDFFVNAYGGFSNLPQNDKSRVDEITNCIAMVVNEPPVNPQEPKTGHWITTPREPQPFDGIDFGDEEKTYHITCSECGYQFTSTSKMTNYRFCPNCGARMESEVEE